MIHKKRIEDRKTTILKSGWYTIDGLLVEIKEDVKVEYTEEVYTPEYITKYPQLQHSYSGGAGRFYKFKSCD